MNDPLGTFATQALLCTDQEADPIQILLWFARRAQMEVTFLDLPYSTLTLQRLADELAERTGSRVEKETVRVHLKAAEIVLRRPQHTISSPDPEYAVKKRRMKRAATT